MTTQKSNKSPVSNEPNSIEQMRQQLKSPLSYRVLEGRVAFDAAMVVTAVEVAADNHEADTPDVAASAEPVQPVTAGDVSVLAGTLSNSAPPAAGRSVVFVDGAVNDPARIAAAAPQGAEIVMLDRAHDGVTQIASYLAGKSGFDAIHIVSHGDAGSLQLGSSNLTLESISGEHADEMAIVRAALSDDADILVYGCDVSAGVRGQSFVGALSAATGADVAASIDDTGSAHLGGDWDLETRLGLIEAGLIDAPEWNGLLAHLTISTTALPATSGATGMDGNIGIFIPSGGVGYTAVWTNAGTVGSTIIDIRATVTSLSASSVSFYTIGDDPSVILNGPATATIKWEIFAADATHSLSIAAVGSPNFQIADIDGVGGVPNTRETVRPQLNGLTSYTVDNPTNLVTTVSASGVQVSGTQNQNNETTSLTRFTWQDVSTWSVDYTFAAGSGFGNAISRHDGDGDFTFVAPVTTYLLSIDLDANNSTSGVLATDKTYETTYVENGMGVAVVDADATISQHAALGTTIGSATVRLANAKTGDVLNVGTLPSGITATINTSVSGQITVSLSGTASVASYQNALEAITFASTSENPDTTNRQIEVSVRNGTFGTTSNVALSTIQVARVNDAPVASADIASQIVGSPVTISVLGNDTDIDNALDPASVQITGSAGPGQQLTVAGEGTWSVTTATGAITFTPAPGFTGNPATISYSVADLAGERSAAVSVSVLPLYSAPHLDLSGPSNFSGAFLYGHSTAPYANGAGGTGVFGSIGNEVAGSGVGLAYDGSSVDVSQLGSATLADAVKNQDFISMTVTTLASIPEAWIQNTVKRNAGGTYEFAIAISTDGFQTATVLSQANPGSDFTAPFYDAPGSSYPFAPASDYRLAANTTYEIRAYIYNATSGTARWDDFYVFYSNDPVNHETTFTEGGAAVSLSAANIEIEDAVQANMASGTILLTNKQASDRFVIGATAVSNGSTGTVSGITYTVTETAGTIQIALSGNATKASYAALINSIKFENTSDAPASVDRTITVTVSDGIETSNVATALIHVVPVNDAPLGNPANATSSDGQPVTVDAGAAFTDAEGDDIDYTISGLPAGLTFDPETGVISGTLGPNASQGGTSGVDTVTVNATDGTATTTRTFTLTISNPAPVAVADTRATHENISQITGNVLTNDHDTAPDADSLTVSTGQNASGGALPIGTETTLPSGAKLTLNADGSYIYKPNGAFEGLDTDETGTDTFTYTASDGQGGTATTTVTITIDGRNDAPQAGTLPNITGQDGDTVSLNLGALVNDPDVEPLTFAISGLPAGLSFNPATGLVTGQIDYSASQNGLFAAPGGGMIYMISVSISDGDAEITRTFQYKVTNPAPDAKDDALTAEEDGPNVTGSIYSNNGYGVDVDGASDGDPLMLTAVNGAAGNIGQPISGSNGGLITIAANGTITFNPNGNFEDLDAGETRTTSVTYTISDGQGGFDSATVTFTVTGSNDAPYATNNTNNVGEDATSPVTGNVQTNDNGFGVDSDPDNETLYVTNVNGNAVSGATSIAGLYGTLTINLDGTYSYALNSALAAVQGLGDGQTLTETFAYTIADGLNVTIPVNNGGVLTDTANLTITISGANDAPVPADDSLPANEDGPAATLNVISGSGNDTDAEGDTLTVSEVGGAAANVGAPVAGSNGGLFTIGSDGALSFNPNGGFEDLAQGETRTSTVTYTVSDGHGGTDTATVTVTVTGSNDAPVVIDPVTGLTATDPNTIVPQQNAADSAAITPLDVMPFFTDPDASDTLTLSIDTATLPSGIAFDPLTGTFSGTPHHSASQGGPNGDGLYPIVVTATDPYGATVTTTVVFAIANPAPIAANDDLGGTENQSLSGSVFTANGHGADSDPDGDSFAVSAVDGSAANIGSATAGSNGGAFTISASGVYGFVPGTDFDDLAQGETRVTSIEYTVSDGEGGFDTATVSVTVTGTNDTPFVIDPATGLPPADPDAIIPVQNNSDSETITPLDVRPFFTDTDTSDALTLAVDPASLPQGITFDPATGTFSGTIQHEASQGGPNSDGIYPIVITAIDPYGATTTTTVVFTIINPPPVAVNDAFSTTENAGFSGSVFAINGGGADHDPDGDAFSVSAINGNAADVGQPVAGTNGGTFTLDSTGALLFVPGTDFDDLAQGETRSTSVSYTIDDGNGGTSTASVTVTVTGTNDTPYIIDPVTGLAPSDPAAIVPVQARADGAPITPLDVTGFFTDTDMSDTLTLSVDPAAVPGGLIFNPVTGTFSGTPTHDTSQGSSLGQPAGTCVIPVTATDPYGATATTFVVFSIINPAPVATDDTGAVSEDGPAASGDVLTNDADGGADTDTLTVAAVNGDPSLVGEPVAGSVGGTFKLNADGSWSFDPGRDFDNLAAGNTRETTITYRVSDGNGGTAEATITVTVSGANDAPVAFGPIPPRTGVEGTTITPIDTTAGFNNPTGAPLTYTATNLPEGLSIDPVTGLITGTPASEASVAGPYTVMITATAPGGETATIALQIGVTNPPPSAADDKVTTLVDTPVTFAPIANDTDPDHDPLSVTAITPPANGTAAINPDGTISYIPNAGFVGTETLTYTVSDGEGGTTTATITITVGAPPADAPVVAGGVAPQTGTDAAPITAINAGGLFSDPNGGPLAFSATGLPPGLVIDPSTGVISGTLEPDASVDGPYSVTVTALDPDGNQFSTTFVLGVANPAPIASNDGVQTPADTPVTIAPLANDSDPDGDTLSISHVSTPAHGTVTVNPDGTLTYTPNAGFVGTETLTYTVSDGEGGTDIATVTIAVGTPLAGAPETPIASITQSPQDGAPIAAINMGPMFTDPAGQPLTFTATGLPVGLAIEPNTGIVTGTVQPGASAEGPYNVIITATDPDGNQVSMTLILTPTNPSPLAHVDTASANRDQPVTIGVLANDLDPDGDTLSVTGASDPAHGSVVINRDGTISYTPSTGFIGTDTFSYTVSDGNGGVVTATVTVSVGRPGGLAAQPGLAPVSGSDGAAIAPFTVGAAFGDPDQTRPLTLKVDQTALPPGITFNPVTGEFSGTPAANASQGSTPGEPTGTYIVPVTATDVNGASTTTYVAFSFVNLAPVAVNDTATASEDDPAIAGNVMTDVLTGDADTLPDSDAVTVTAAAQGTSPITLGTPFTVAGGGVLTLNADGSYSFNPGTSYNNLGAGETEIETINYTISDGNGGTATATLVITVEGVNDAPVTVNPKDPGTPENPKPTADPLNIIPDVSTFDSKSPAPINAGDYFRDPEGKPLTFAATGLPPGLKIDPVTGVITGTLKDNASQGGPNKDGVYTVTITAMDAGGLTTNTTVTYTVKNPAPVAVNDTAATREDQTVTIKPLGNDSDPDGDKIVIVAAAAGNGSVTIKPDGSIIYTPKPGFAGTDTIKYVISDDNGGFATASITVEVAADAAANRQTVFGLSGNGAFIGEGAKNNTGEALEEGGREPMGLDPPVVHTVNTISWLGGVDFIEGEGIVETVVDAASRSSGITGLDAVAIDALTGFSLRSAAGSTDGEIVIESMVQNKTLIVKMSGEGLPNGIDWTVSSANGDPLPGWLSFAGDGVLMGERAADAEEIELRFTAELPDGTVVVRYVKIQTMSGEIQQLERSRSGWVPPRLIWDQLKAYPMIEERDIRQLARALG